MTITTEIIGRSLREIARVGGIYGRTDVPGGLENTFKVLAISSHSFKVQYLATGTKLAIGGQYRYMEVRGPVDCAHRFVNVGFTSLTYACADCGTPAPLTRARWGCGNG